MPVLSLRCVSFFLHHAEIITFAGKSYRLRNRAEGPKPAKALTGSASGPKPSKPAKAPTGSEAEIETNGTDKD